MLVKSINGNMVTVRRLGLFELDENVPRNIPGPYTVTILFADGNVYQQPYRLDRPTPPGKPTIPVDQAQPGTPEYYAWQDYLRYQEAVLHVRKQYEAYADYCERVAGYIREHCLASSEFDVFPIFPEDWDKIYQAALCPQVTMEDIAAAMRLYF